MVVWKPFCASLKKALLLEIISSILLKKKKQEYKLIFNKAQRNASHQLP